MPQLAACVFMMVLTIRRRSRSEYTRGYRRIARDRRRPCVNEHPDHRSASTRGRRAADARGPAYDSASHVVVREGNRFAGIVRIEDLLAAVVPAYASGPLATVIQDLLSILIYFLIATQLIV